MPIPQKPVAPKVPPKPVAVAAPKVPPKPGANLPAKIPPKETALSPWEEELAADAQQESEKEKTPSGQFVSLKGGIVQVGGNPVEGNALQCIIVGVVHENVYYTDGFDPDNTTSPVCYAFGEVEEGMAPHEDSTEPQHDTCEGCPQNAWGSSERGKGKACKNMRRLALVSTNGLTPENLEDAEVLYVKIPVTSVKAWAMLVKGLAATLRRPVWSVAVELSAEPDAKTNFKVNFRVVEPLGQEWMPGLKTLREKVAEAIKFPYAKPTPAAEGEEVPEEKQAAPAAPVAKKPMAKPLPKPLPGKKPTF